VPVILILALVTQVPLARSAGQAQAIATKRHIVLVESLSGVETVKSLGAEPAMQREWEDAVAASSRVGGRTRFWSNLATNGTMLIQQSVSVIIIVWGVFLVSEGRISIGGLIAANILAGRILAPMGTIAQTVFRAQYAFKSLSALNAFMALPVEAGPTVLSDLSVSHARVELRNVTLTYPGQKVPVLRDISLTIAPGEAVALLGRVGAGKTTLGKLIAGLIQPDAGAVLIDGVAQAQYDPAALRRGIGYLPQNPDIFTGTLRENLTLGAPAATDAQIARALYFAAMDRFVGELPDGLDTFLGERGSRLSGGQRQALALARLILRKPRLLFLDEPTSAMDHRMEAEIARRLGELRATGMGMILSTHRQSLAGVAGRIVVMDSGAIVLDGPRDQIMARLAASLDHGGAHPSDAPPPPSDGGKD
jgi:ATP-binding cassette subfamily C protein LapB